MICQIESVTGLANLDAIAGCSGVDVLWVGHFDLSNSMGIPRRFDEPRFVDALQQVAEAAKRHGKAAGIQPGNPRQASEWTEIGFNALSWASDAALYRGALAAAVAALREQAGQRRL